MPPTPPRSRDVTQKFQQFCARKAGERLGDGGEEGLTGQEGDDPSPACPFPSRPRHAGLHRAPRVLGTPQTFSWGEGQPLPHGWGDGGSHPTSLAASGEILVLSWPILAQGMGWGSAVATSPFAQGVQGGSRWHLMGERSGV